MFQFLDKVSENFLITLKRFPMVSISAYLMTFILLVFTITGHGTIEKYPNFNVANKIAFLMTLAMPLFFVLRLFSKKYFITLLGIMLLIGYYFLLPENLKTENSAFFQRHFLWILALMIFSIVVPFLSHSTNNKDFWEWTQQIMFALISTFIFALILFLGLEGAKFAVEKLFNIDIQYSIEKPFLLIIFGIFAINYFLSQVPKEPRLVVSRSYSKVENVFTKYILTPLVLIYFLILFAYTFKIIFLSQFPTGRMSWLVLIFSGLGIITFLFWTPLWNRKNRKYKKWIWIAILLQTFVLGLSIYMRIEQYGVTENRYFIALSGLWLFLISLYFLLFKHASYKWIFISLALFIVVSQTEPFSSQSIAKASQTQKLKLLLAEGNFSEETNSSVKYAISSKIDYLHLKYGIEALMPVIPDIVAEYQLLDKNSSDCSNTPYMYFPHYATNQLGFKYIDKWEWEQTLRSKKVDMPIFINNQLRYNNADGLNIKGYDWLEYFFFHDDGDRGVRYCPPEDEKADINIEKSAFIVKPHQHNIVIEKASETIATIGIDDFLKNIKKEWKERYASNDKSTRPFEGNALSQKELTLLYENEQVKVKFLFQSIEFTPITYKLMDYSGRLLIHEK